MTQGVKRWNEFGVVQKSTKRNTKIDLNRKAMLPVSKKNGQADRESVR